MTQVRIALSGVRGAGKSTARELLYAALREQDNSITVQLARCYKEAASDISGLQYRAFDDPAVKDRAHPQLGFAPRKLVIAIGEMVHKLRKETGMAWYPIRDMLLREMSETPEARYVVVEDLRTPEESAMLKAMGFIRIRIENDRLQKDPQPHITEAGCECDHVVKNNGTITEFRENIFAMCHEILIPRELKQV